MSNGQNSPYGLSVVSSAIGNGGTQKLKGYKIYADVNGANSQTMSIFCGDPVKIVPIANGQTPATSPLFGTITGAYTPVTGAVANAIAGSVLGIFQYCTYESAQTNVLTNSNYWPSSTLVKAGTTPIAYINDDPEVVFEVQISTSNNGTALANGVGLADPVVFTSNFIGQNANLQVGGLAFAVGVANAATNNPVNGNPSTGISAYYLDGSSITTANAGGGNPGFNVKIIGIPSDVSLVPSAIAGLVPGNTMPFISLLCKFNNHAYGSVGVPGPFIAGA